MTFDPSDKRAGAPEEPEAPAPPPPPRDELAKEGWQHETSPPDPVSRLTGLPPGDSSPSPQPAEAAPAPEPPVPPAESGPPVPPASEED